MLTAEMTNAEAMERFVLAQDKIDATVWALLDPVVAEARRRAPHKTGDLRRGIIKMPRLEKSKFAGKAVGQIVIAREMNDTFVKMTLAGKRYYYPASQEYGFRSRTKSGSEKRVPGRYYMLAAAVAAEPDVLAAAERLVEVILLD